jgi:hypothetical protein
MSVYTPMSGISYLAVLFILLIVNLFNISGGFEVVFAAHCTGFIQVRYFKYNLFPIITECFTVYKTSRADFKLD